MYSGQFTGKCRIAIWDRGSEKRPSAFFFKVSNYFIFLRDTYMYVLYNSFLTRAQEISLSVMELQWIEFVITRTFLIAHVNIEVPFWNMRYCTLYACI